MLIQSKGNPTQETRCVFSDGTGKYKNVDRVYSLKSSITETLDNLINMYNKPYGVSKVTRDGMKLIFTTYNNSGTNGSNVTGISDAGGTVTERVKHNDGAGIGSIYAYTSGGANDPVDADDTSVGAPATLTVDLSGAAHDSGFKFESNDFRIVDPNKTLTEKYNVITLTKGTASSGYADSVRNFRYDFDGSKITFTATSNGTSYNGKVFSGVSYSYYSDDSVEYTAYTPLVGKMTVEQNSEARVSASWEMDLSGMTVDDFSAQYSGKLLKFGDSSTVYKFYDSSLEPRLEGIRESSFSLDINNVRQRVNAGSSLADAVQAEWYNSFYSSPEVDGDKVRFSAYSNNETVKLMEDNLRHYDINFAQLDGKITMPDDLYGKGFQVYCASDPVEWFNFVFTDGTKTYSSSNEDIKPINIDVSNVHNSSELVQAIYDQATPLLTGNDPTLNHFMRVAADPDTGILTLYDNRRYNVNTSSYDYQEKGAKIADGVAFDIKDLDESETSTLEAEYFYGKDLVIQHTDKASMNIRIKIPQMTLDHIFAPLPDENKTIFDYPVTDKASRDALLGTAKKKGILDKGLTYLLDAATLVGAQNRRLEFTATNITTEIENLIASESTISDADMAKEMAEYTKANILTQAAQSMLAQANQSQSMVLSLLG